MYYIETHRQKKKFQLILLMFEKLKSKIIYIFYIGKKDKNILSAFSILNQS